MFPSLKRNSSGFGLMEVIVAAGLMGILSVGVMKMMEMQSTGSKNTMQNMEIANLHGEIAGFLAQQDVATFNFQGLNPTTVNALANLRNTDSSVRYQAGQQYGSPKVEITSMSLGGSFDSIGGDVSFGRVPLTIVYNKKNMGNERAVNKTIGITVRLNGGVIQTAQTSASTAGDSAGYWAANPSGIHYNDGNVGIGTTTPTSELQVEGWIKAKTGHGRYIELGGDAASDDYELRLDSSQPLTIWDKVNGTTGSVTMKALNLTNQTNPQNQACVHAGETRYNHTSKTLEVCDGASYRTVGPTFSRCSWRHSIKTTSDYFNFVNCNPGEVVVSGSCYLPSGANSIYASVALTNMGHRCGATGAVGTCSRWWCGVSPNAVDIEVNAYCCAF